MPGSVNYQCLACGGPLRFDGPTQMLVCDFCDSSYTVEQVEAAIRAQVDAAREREQLAYAISLSIGCSLAHRDEPVNAIMAKADRGLYGQKDTHHAASQE